MTNFSLQADMRRAKDRCPACARQQLHIENGQYVPGDEVKGQLYTTRRGGGSSRRARAAAASRGGGGGGGTSSSSSSSGSNAYNALAQHEIRPEEIVCTHCLCSNENHEDTGPNGQRCCGGLREGLWDRVCELCKASESCRAWARARACPAEEAGRAPGEPNHAGNSTGEKPCKTEGRANFCMHCTCPCAQVHPHTFEDKSNWMSTNPEVQRACRICLPCWAGWCIPLSGTKRKLVGATMEPEEPFARQWRPGRDADVFVLTGLFDELTGLLPENGFPYAVFGSSLRYFKGLIGSAEAKHALKEAGVTPGDRSGAIGEAWSGGGSMYPPERPAGARKVVAAPLRQGEGANRHFSRVHGRRDHNWQWDMLKSPWSLGLMAKGRLALGVSEEEANEFEEAGIIAFPGHVVKHKDSVKNGGYGKTIGTLVLRSPESAFVCVQGQGERLGRAVELAEELGVELPPRVAEKGRFKFAINELDAWAMVGGTARNDAEHAVVCGRKVIPAGEPGEGFVRVAFNMRWGWQDDRRV
ncbi:hypothetical protein Esi_0000_0364 [Ectocarpus siliculosus]|uniref:Uncharacterized protein n=1 Tax=Ectocarpus siliculosus TaxID=2880 RepID=D8LBB8_ECTSI|nr:hypothetical protein Esi_0000_0364 [Ectocarpus siliculosus]|eukprot:CBN76627.1 hypothetical protein Esi_0000_0364 [Ectocarpus siliculosus]